jgi:hypothetical protein
MFTLQGYFWALIFGIILSCLFDLFTNPSNDGKRLNVQIVITSFFITIVYVIGFLVS